MSLRDVDSEDDVLIFETNYDSPDQEDDDEMEVMDLLQEEDDLLREEAEEVVVDAVSREDEKDEGVELDGSASSIEYNRGPQPKPVYNLNRSELRMKRMRRQATTRAPYHALYKPLGSRFFVTQVINEMANDTFYSTFCLFDLHLQRMFAFSSEQPKNARSCRYIALHYNGLNYQESSWGEIEGMCRNLSNWVERKGHEIITFRPYSKGCLPLPVKIERKLISISDDVPECSALLGSVKFHSYILCPICLGLNFLHQDNLISSGTVRSWSIGTIQDLKYMYK